MKIKRKVISKLLDELNNIQDGLGLAIDDVEELPDIEVKGIEDASAEIETKLEALHDEIGGVVTELQGYLDGLFED